MDAFLIPLGLFIATIGAHLTIKVIEHRKDNRPVKDLNKIKTVRDGYNTSVDSAEDAMKDSEPYIRELIDFVEISIWEEKRKKREIIERPDYLAIKREPVKTTTSSAETSRRLQESWERHSDK